ncbi:MAG: hypothetical protein KBA26_06925 [Candidatus Delongbacteria bacterium]|nr:hypothetical protein [Candidatus Delongbacteria bacterium]
MRTDKIKKVITPELYHDFIQQIDLKSIVMTEGKFTLNDIKLHKLRIEVVENHKFKCIESGFVVITSFTLSGKSDDHCVPLKIECTYQLYYLSEKKMTREIFDIFSQSSLPLNIWPYFREFVHDCSSKMGIPALVLPLVKR